MQYRHAIRIITAVQAFIHLFKNLKRKLYNCRVNINFNIFSIVKRLRYQTSNTVVASFLLSVCCAD